MVRLVEQEQATGIGETGKCRKVVQECREHRTFRAEQICRGQGHERQGPAEAKGHVDRDGAAAAVRQTDHGAKSAKSYGQNRLTCRRQMTAQASVVRARCRPARCS